MPLTLTAGVFDRLEGLKVLTLHSLASLPADLFAGTPNLVILTRLPKARLRACRPGCSTA